VAEVLRSPEARNTLLAQGAEPSTTSPEEFSQFLMSEIKKWGAVIKNAGIQPY
jgi:tripartite-type tricarboxylate transporter receptor subunit TctC